MNERIKELARQAGFNDFPNDVNGVWITDGYWEEELERFAELVRQDEREQAEKQEPVAYKYTDKTNPLVFYFTERKDVTPNPDVIETALYTAPPKREWVGLTDEEMENLVGFMRGNTMIDFARAIEAKLKEKNT
jgi:hypothetical protein